MNKGKYFSRQAGARSNITIEVTPFCSCNPKHNKEIALLPDQVPFLWALLSTTMGLGRMVLGLAEIIREITQDHTWGKSSNTDKQTHGVPNKWVKSHLKRVKSPPPLSPPFSLLTYHAER